MWVKGRGRQVCALEGPAERDVRPRSNSRSSSKNVSGKLLNLHHMSQKKQYFS